MLKAVIFDFDGIIVDSEPMHYKAFSEVLKPEEKDFTWEEYCDIYIGYDDRDAFTEAYKAKGEQICARVLKRLIKEKAEVFQQLIHNGEANPLPGAVELITSLPGRVPVALCSGALREDIDPIVEQLGIADAFSVIVTADDTPVSKPDPAPYMEAWKRLQEKYPELNGPEEAIAIEDTPAGIISAKGAGMKVLAVTNSYDREFLHEATAITDSLEKVNIATLHDLII